MIEKPVLVSVAIIRKGNKFLVTQREKDSNFGANMWEFPGGKVEFLEHPEKTLTREIKEEVGIDVSVDKLLTIISHSHEKNGAQHHFIRLVFLCDHVSGDVEHLEVQDSKWVTLDQFEDVDFTPADKTIAEFYTKDLK